MAEEVMTITVPSPVFDSATIHSVNAKVKGAATIAAKAGHLVFLGSDGTWVANTVATDLAAKTEVVGVLGTDTDLTTTATDAKVIIAGIVYINGVRAAGIEEAKASDNLLYTFAAKQSGVTFVKMEDR